VPCPITVRAIVIYVRAVLTILPGSSRHSTLCQSMDVIAPLVHEFTCQAMASDLLPINVGVYEDKTVVLTTSSAISPADGSTMPPCTSSLVVCLLIPSFYIQVRLMFDASLGTSSAEELFQRLTSSPTELLLWLAGPLRRLLGYV
jgi:hypothetical protein